MEINKNILEDYYGESIISFLLIEHDEHLQEIGLERSIITIDFGYKIEVLPLITYLRHVKLNSII